MYNKLVKGVASVLGAALVLGSVLMSVVPAQAASTKGANGYETTYRMGDLTWYDGATNNFEITDFDAVTINFQAQYATAYFTIPKEVLDAGIIGFRYKASIPVEKLEISLAADDAWNKLILFAPKVEEMGLHMLDNGTRYNTQWQTQETWTEADLKDIERIGIGYSDSDAPTEVTVTEVTFITENPVGGEAAGGNENKAETTTSTTTTSSKTGESTTLLWVVCALGGMLLISATGMVVTEKKRR